MILIICLVKLQSTLRSILDPYETPKIVAAAMAEIMPIVSKDRPDVFQKLKRMKTDPLQEIFKGCKRSGFPNNTSTN